MTIEDVFLTLQNKGFEFDLSYRYDKGYELCWYKKEWMSISYVKLPSIRANSIRQLCSVFEDSTRRKV